MRILPVLAASIASAAVVCAAGCGSVKSGNLADAPPSIDAAVDAPASDAASCPKTLLAGGSDVAPQGWSIVMQPPATLSYALDYVKLETSTTTGAKVSGQLLLDYPGALDAGQPFKLEIVMLVEAVDPHNQFDSAAAILGSFTPQFGAGNDRSEMIYLDADKIGWADDTQSFAVTVLDNAYHTYVLAVDAAGAAQVSVDGVAALTRAGFTSNGAIAIGDQTNDAAVDSTLRIRSVTRLCM